MDITKLTLEEMVALQKQLESALPDMKKQRVDELRESIKQQVEKAGLTLDEVLRPLLPNKTVKKTGSDKPSSRKPAAVKYQLDGKTWTGKGKKPQWFLDFVEANGNAEALRAVPEAPAEKTE
ncbi:H-NS histone family protein [uncultured Zoogloea sp.]|uniref:H-NS histone family protein n=1 Tax=uncultured Zoogloea sp. TaxID=160237 RepID=UPI002610E850|nr:H-NS histone family protein [uncultured Zoogloea sp.]